MLFLYQLSVWLYAAVVYVLSPFKTRAGEFVGARKGNFARIATDFEKVEGKCVWFHAASLGEYEQARPLIHLLKTDKPDVRVLVTFFSPSGYTLGKKNQEIDHVHFLPIDSKANARRFMDLVKPQLAIFVKYELWYFFLTELKERSVPSYLISGIFRKNQMYFHSMGRFYRPALASISHYFVQDQSSGQLLDQIGISNWSISGDTRFDRVLRIASERVDFPKLETFVQNKKVIILGSVWPVDMEVITPVLLEYIKEYKFIIAPHNVDQETLRQLDQLPNTICYSQAEIEKLKDAGILIIDQKGILSRIYRYAKLAIVGGAFRDTLHNTLEPAVYGIPVLFGYSESNQKFIEAVELERCGGGFSFTNGTELKKLLNRLLTDENNYAKACEASRVFVASRSGAAEKIYAEIKNLI